MFKAELTEISREQIISLSENNMSFDRIHFYGRPAIFFSSNCREMLQVITSLTKVHGFFCFPGKLIFSSAIYRHSSKILLFAFGVTVHASPFQQSLL